MASWALPRDGRGRGLSHVGLLKVRIERYTPVTVLYAELPLLELVVADSPVGECQGVPGVVLQGRAVALQGCREVSFSVPGEWMVRYNKGL